MANSGATILTCLTRESLFSRVFRVNRETPRRDSSEITHATFVVDAMPAGYRPDSDNCGAIQAGGLQQIRGEDPRS